MEQQLDKDSKLIYPTRFMFADGKEADGKEADGKEADGKKADEKELRIKFHNEVSGWQLAMESSNKVYITRCI